MGWDDNNTRKLAALWREGLSASQIARALNAQFETQFTRNAIISKIHRLGLSGRTTAHKTKTKVKRKEGRAAGAADWQMQRRMRKAQIERPLPEPDGVTDVSADAYDAARATKTLAELEQVDCKWPIGDPRESGFGFCGAARIAGYSYCLHHTLRATETAADRTARSRRHQMSLRNLEAHPAGVSKQEKEHV